MAPNKEPSIPVPGNRGRSHSPGGTTPRSRSRSGSIPADAAIRAHTPPKGSPSPPHRGVVPRIPVQRNSPRGQGEPATTGNLADQMGMPSVVQHQAPPYIPLEGREPARGTSPIFANAEHERFVPQNPSQIVPGSTMERDFILFKLEDRDERIKNLTAILEELRAKKMAELSGLHLRMDEIERIIKNGNIKFDPRWPVNDSTRPGIHGSAQPGGRVVRSIIFLNSIQSVYVVDV